MNHLPKVVFSVFFLFAGILTAFPQDPAKKDLAKSVVEADRSFYYDKNYVKAASLYEPLVNPIPG